MNFTLKTLGITILFLFILDHAFGQIINQKQTQKKYLIQQITALQLYIGYLQKGYSIARNGLNTISDLKQGEFGLHDDFFSSLKKVNPKITSYARVVSIITLQSGIVKAYKKTLNLAKESQLFNSGEISYVSRVYGRLMDDCVLLLDELTNVTINNNLEMTDDERLNRIDLLFTRMQDNYKFAHGFADKIVILERQRKKDEKDVKTSRLLNGIKP